MKNQPVRKFLNTPHHRDSIIEQHDITVQQAFPREVTVLTWTSKAKDGGHSSLMLRNTMTTNAYEIDEGLRHDLNNYRYVSFSSDNKGGGKFLRSYFKSMTMMIGEATHLSLTGGKFRDNPRPNQVVYEHIPHMTEVSFNHSFDDTIGDPYNDGRQKGMGHDGRYFEQWGTLPNRSETVAIPMFDINHIGLNPKRMIDWCNRHRNSTTFVYKKISNENNCASVAWRALEAGGGLAFCKAGGKNPPSHNFYITPKDLKDYAQYISFGVQRVEDYYTSVTSHIDKSLRRQPGIVNAAQAGFNRAMIKDDPLLYTIDDWKSETKGGNIFGFRGKCADFDSDIREYATYQWNSLDPISTNDHYTKKLTCLLEILRKLYNLWLKNENYCKIEQPALVALSAQVCRILDKKLRKAGQENWGTISYYTE